MYVCAVKKVLCVVLYTVWCIGQRGFHVTTITLTGFYKPIVKLLNFALPAVLNNTLELNLIFIIIGKIAICQI